MIIILSYHTLVIIPILFYSIHRLLWEETQRNTEEASSQNKQSLINSYWGSGEHILLTRRRQNKETEAMQGYNTTPKRGGTNELINEHRW